jgi:hypothetical protein
MAPTRARWRRVAPWLAVVAVLLLAARIALPYALQRYVNRVLDENPAYTGSVGDIDVNLWRGAYEIEALDLRKRSGEVAVPLFSAAKTDLSVEWRALFEGALVGEVAFEQAELNFVQGPSEGSRQTGAEADWRDTVKRLFPLRINRLAVHDGTIHYRDFHSDPKVDVYVNDVEAVVTNLTNSRDISSSLVATAELRGVAMGDGPVRLRASFDPYAEPDRPTFDFDGELRGLDLRRLNPFLRAYAGLDVQAGRLELFTELNAEDGRFEGYVKPLVEDLDVLRVEEEAKEQGVLATIWEAIAGASAELLENQPEDRQAARVPISGTATSPQTGFWATLASTLRNAFVEALAPRLEGSVGRD